MKYITTKSEEGKTEIFLFPRDINHDAMAEAIARVRNQTTGEWRRIRREPVSAGFVTGGVCHGESETLRLKSCESDTALLPLPNPQF
jgi:hypothetical protein